MAGNTVQLIGQRSMNHVVSKIEGVQRGVWELTQDIGQKAERNLAKHRQTGNARIEIEFGKTDGMIWLVDPGGNAMAIEFGHFLVTSTGFPRYVAGLYILSKAGGLF